MTLPHHVIVSEVFKLRLSVARSQANWLYRKVVVLTSVIKDNLKYHLKIVLKIILRIKRTCRRYIVNCFKLFTISVNKHSNIIVTNQIVIVERTEE